MCHARSIAVFMFGPVLGLLGCDARPERIYLPKLPIVVYDRAPTATVHPIALDKQGKAMPEVQLTYSALPADVLTVAGGVTQCLRNGKAEVLVESGRTSARTSIECRIVTELTVPDSMRLVLGQIPSPITFAAKAGEQAIDHPPVLFDSENPEIARVEYGNARALAPGKTIFRARLGALQKPINVEVVEAGDSAREQTGDAVMPTQAATP